MLTCYFMSTWCAGVWNFFCQLINWLFQKAHSPDRLDSCNFLLPSSTCLVISTCPFFGEDANPDLWSNLKIRTAVGAACFYGSKNHLVKMVPAQKTLISSQMKENVWNKDEIQSRALDLLQAIHKFITKLTTVHNNTKGTKIGPIPHGHWQLPIWQTWQYICHTTPIEQQDTSGGEFLSDWLTSDGKITEVFCRLRVIKQRLRRLSDTIKEHKRLFLSGTRSHVEANSYKYTKREASHEGVSSLWMDGATDWTSKTPYWWCHHCTGHVNGQAGDFWKVTIQCQPSAIDSVGFPCFRLHSQTKIHHFCTISPARSSSENSIQP